MDNSKNMCSSCFTNTKYVCIECRIPICNKCSIFEINEDTGGWTAGRSVGLCEPCFKAKKLPEQDSHGRKQRKANNG